jgi:hypothetical protein
MSRLGAVLLCALICCAGLGGGLLAAEPKGDAAVAAVFPPWWSASQSLAAAASAGDVSAAGALPFVFIVQPRDPGLHARLRAAGALLLMNPLGMAGCAQQPAKKQNV